MEKNIRFSFRLNLFVPLFFALSTSIFTFPLVTKLTTSIYGFSKFRGDPFGTLWWIWWYRYAWVSKVSSSFIYLIAYPFGLDWSAHPTSPLLDYPVAILNFLINNEIITYNLVILLGFFLSAIFMFKLAKKIVKDINASILAGIIFAFCPNQLMQSAQHLGFSTPFWIIIYVFTLYKLSISINYRNMFLCSIAFSLVMLSNYYYGYFMAIFTLIWFSYMVVLKKRKFLTLRNLMIMSSGFILVLLIIAPFIMPKSLLINDIKIGYTREFKDLFKYAARWWDYFLPSEFHPVFGKWTRCIIDRLGGRHYFERSLYIGYIPLFLAIVAIVKWWREERRNSIIPFFVFTSILFFIFSLKPIFQIGNIKIPNFSFFAYKLLPMFRVYSRMGIVVMLSIATLAAYGLKYILGGIKKKWCKRAMGCFCIILVLFEYINFPPFHNIDLSMVPDVYQWLADESGDIVIVEYPFVRNIEETHSEYLFYQRIHKKKMVNGASEGTLGDAFRRECLYPNRLETAKLLAYLGADYMVIHKDKYSGSELEEIDKNPGLRIIKDFPEARIYEITAKSDNLTTVFWESFASWERWNDGNYWRWLGNNATIWIGVKEPETVNIKFKILAFAKTRELQVYINDILIKNIEIASPSDSMFAQELLLENVALSSGENVIHFYTPQGETRIGDVLGNEDNRRVSFAISEFNIVQNNSSFSPGV